MNLIEALAVQKKDIIALVGGGGKTTLMYALAKEIAAAGRKVVSTTTTRIREPSAYESERLILINDDDMSQIREALTVCNHITIAGSKMPDGKLGSIELKTVSQLKSLEYTDNIIIEADGAAGHPLKAPRDYEPVIPAETNIVVVLVGIDALGERLDRVVFRPEVAISMLNTTGAVAVTPEMIAELVTNKRGLAKGTPSTARIIPFLNKLDLKDGLQKGRLVAQAILSRGHPQINCVVLGQVKKSDPVVEVIRNF